MKGGKPGGGPPAAPGKNGGTPPGNPNGGPTCPFASSLPFVGSLLTTVALASLAVSLKK